MSTYARISEYEGLERKGAFCVVIVTVLDKQMRILVISQNSLYSIKATESELCDMILRLSFW